MAYVALDVDHIRHIHPKHSGNHIQYPAGEPSSRHGIYDSHFDNLNDWRLAAANRTGIGPVTQEHRETNSTDVDDKRGTVGGEKSSA